MPEVDIPRVTERGVRSETTSSGAAGDIQIDARSLTVQHGVSVHAGSIGTPEVAQRGDAGDVTIHADSVQVSDRSYIATGGWGSTGKVGTLTIDLGDDGSLVVDGATDETQIPRPRYSPRYAWILAKNGGTPGSLAILGNGSVELVNGGEISADSGIGDAGTITIHAASFVVNSGGLINAGTSGAGDGGTINIHDADSLVIGSGSVTAATFAAGNAGTINIHDADSLVIGSGAPSPPLRSQPATPARSTSSMPARS